MELNEPQQISTWDRRMDEIAQRDTVPDPTLVRIVTELDVRLKQALDLGCGAGRHLCWLAANGWVTTGLDWSREAVETTKNALKLAGLKASVVKGDLKSLKFPPGSFPLIISTAVLHHNQLAGFKRSLIEIKRMLKIGGYAVISVPSLNHPGAKRPGSWAEKGTLIPSSGPETGIPHHYFTEDEIRAVTGQFRSVTIELTVDSAKPGEEPEGGLSGSSDQAGTDIPEVWDGSVSVDVTPAPRLQGDPLSGEVVKPVSQEKPAGKVYGGWYWIVLKG